MKIGVPESCLFYRAVVSSGLTFDLSSDPNQGHALQCDKAAFKTRLEKMLSQDINFPQSTQTFCTELIAHLESSDTALLKAMSVLGTSDPTDISDSFLRILLGVNDLYVPISTWMLEKIAISCAESDGSSELTPMLLSQLRWQNKSVTKTDIVDSFLEVAVTASGSDQISIIASIPEIFDDSQHPKIATFLRDALRKQGFYNPIARTILDALSNLFLPPNDLCELRDSIIEEIPLISRLSLNNLPVVVKFVLDGISEGEELHVIRLLRHNLSLPVTKRHVAVPRMKTLASTAFDTELPDIDIHIFDSIRLSMNTMYSVGSAWIQVIDEVDTAENHKSIDLLLLLELYSMPTHRRLVERLLKSKLRKGLITEPLIQRTIAGHAHSLRDVLVNMLALVLVLKISNEPCFNQTACTMCLHLFVHMDDLFQSDILDDLIMGVASGISETQRVTCLQVLAQLAEKHTELLAPFGLRISSILDCLDSRSMTLGQVRQIMDVLSLLSLSSHSSAINLRDDLNILVSKQLASGKANIKQMGVIGAITIVRNMSMSMDKMNGDDSEANDQLQRSLLDLVMKAMKTDDESIALVLDELSHLLQSKIMTKDLVDWIVGSMTDSFIEQFVVDISSETNRSKQDFIPLELRFGLKMLPNSQEEDDVNIAVNLGSLVVQNIMGKLSTVSNKAATLNRLIPEFRLLGQGVVNQNEGDLSSVDALLSCPIWMPSEDVCGKLMSLSLMEQNVVCSCLFYCINFFRELVNCFCLSKKPEDQAAVLIRIGHIIELEKLIMQSISMHPTFIPPKVLPYIDTSSWHPNVQTAKPATTRAKKRKAGAEYPSQITCAYSQSSCIPFNSTQKDSPEPGIISLQHYRPFFRELDVDVFKLVSYGKIAIQCSKNSEPNISPEVLFFLLKDLLSKASHSLIATSNSKKVPFFGKSNEMKNAGFVWLEQTGPSCLVESLVPLLDCLMTNAEEIAEYFKSLIDLNDGLMEGPLVFNEKTQLLTNCLDHLLLLFKVLFSWIGFQEVGRAELLKKALNKIASRAQPHLSHELTLEGLVPAAVKHLLVFKASMLSIGSATALTSLVGAIGSHHKESDEVRKSLSDLAEHFMQIEWRRVADGSIDKGSTFNGHVETLMNCYFSSCPDPIEALQSFVHELHSLLEESNESGRHRTFTKSNLAVHYRVLLDQLVQVTKNLGQQSSAFPKWKTVVGLLFDLVSVPKQSESKLMIASLLKYSRFFLDTFLKNGMPLVEEMFSTHQDECINFLKSLQQSTRYLQHVCTHSKLKRDQSSVNQVPALKRSLETFILSVKDMLAVNNAANLFWMGNLKRRNLKGEVILSQEVDSDDSDEKSDHPNGSRKLNHSTLDNGSDQLPDEEESEEEPQPADKDSDLSSTDDGSEQEVGREDTDHLDASVCLGILA